MATISYTPKNWNGTDTAPNAPEEVRLRIAAQAALDAIQGEVDTLNRATLVVQLTANGTSREGVAKPTARTISAIHARVGATLATGTFTLTISNGAGTTLLSTANIDATTLTITLAGLTLTATPANLSLVAGDSVQATLVSNNGSATGGPVTLVITYT